MADYAHTETDKRIEALENRLQAEYRQAYREIKGKLEKYLSDFVRKDEAKRKLVDEGKLSQADYKKWRTNQMLTGQRWTKMVDTLARDMNRTNQIAADIISGDLKGTFALNANFAAYGIESGFRTDFGFTLYDQETVNRLVVKNPDLLPAPSVDIPADIRWNKQKITSNITQAVLQGKSIPEIAKTMQTVVGMNKASATRNARTAMTGAQNAGRQQAYDRAKAMGIKVKKEWVATLDGRTRHSHGMADGQQIEIDGKFKVGASQLRYPGDPQGRPEEVYNCFVGDTKIASDSNIVRSYKHNYCGKIVSIKTSSGVQFSCTPNHPILTPNGWVAVELLNNGDNILVTSGKQNISSRVNPNINHRFTRIDTIHKFGKIFGGQRTGGLSVNFHGDIATANVEIITHKRFLGNTTNSTGGNCADKTLFKLANKTFSRFCSFFKHFRGICKSPFSFVCGKSKTFSLFKRCLSHSCVHRFRPVSDRNSVLTQYSIKNLPANSVIDGELLNRLSSEIFVDTIVDVNVSVSSCHVYNLQTENGYYFVNSIIPQKSQKVNGIFAIAKNCRCTMVTVEPPEILRGEELRRTFDEWIKTKEAQEAVAKVKSDRAKKAARARKYKRKAAK